jgi:hypothetical protein
VHDVRARYFTEVSSSTKSEAVVREAARHADYRKTHRYIAVAQEELREAIMTADARRAERAANDAANIPDTKSLMRVPEGRKRRKVVRGGKP